ncbi:hypothetical protein Agabi119p4_3402 [Agaricus bisporus var. burnettii]|uniref:Uncharacterized protein n=1 Tax=Agaricus bisporus var. burnettii TaxID=192524 RepID=A0A8H7F704_AGABI|nr:hypothetical protein Agabi119p4_3397 [Agaricus bisporus var. burnettii]KAF7779057.1 hypothetical protein Agabi119p4_3402 [Agaricus bisporus var. burnettii]
MEPQASAHNDPNSNPGEFQVDPQLMEFLDRKFQESLQHELGAFQQVARERFADAEAGWMKTIQQNKEREALLEDQVDDLRRQLEASRKAALPLPVTGPENPATNPDSYQHPRLEPSAQTSMSVHAQDQSSSQPLTTPVVVDSVHQSSGNTPAIEPEAATRKLAEHQLSSKDIPPGATKLKDSLELHIRMLWGHLSATTKPPEVNRSQLAEFNARFAENLNDSELAQICKDSQPLISPSLVQVQASIPLTVATSQSRILSGARRLEEFLLEYIQATTSKFGLTQWCPDLSQSAGSVYNSACRIIALETFRQAVSGQQYRLGSAEKFLKNMPLLIGIYNGFVHYRMRKIFDREMLYPGRTKQLAANNPAYQNRYRLCQSRIEFARANGYKRYLKYLDPKATSDDEADPQGSRVNGRPVHFIKVRRERSVAFNTWIRLLDRERELAAMYEGKTFRQDRIRTMPDNPDESAFPLLPLNMPLDYYDPTFFNFLQPNLRKRIAGAYPTVGLLPEVSHSFGRGPNGKPHKDERLGEKAFNKKYRENVLLRYRLDDLDDIDAFDSDADDDDDDEEEEEVGDRHEEMEEDFPAHSRDCVKHGFACANSNPLRPYQSPPPRSPGMSGSAALCTWPPFLPSLNPLCSPADLCPSSFPFGRAVLVCPAPLVAREGVQGSIPMLSQPSPPHCSHFLVGPSRHTLGTSPTSPNSSGPSSAAPGGLNLTFEIADI